MKPSSSSLPVIPVCGVKRHSPESHAEPASSFEETPYHADDALGRLWVPHRMLYINGEQKPADPSAAECPFCDPVIRADDAAALKKKLVVARGERCYAILNLFPYNSGHVLVLPYRHIPAYTRLDDGETAEFTALTKLVIEAAQAAFGPHGFNIGMNQGEVAGAGIAAHLHQHVVPRWLGDANFLPITGQTKAMPQLLGDTRQALADHWPAEPPLATAPSRIVFQPVR